MSRTGWPPTCGASGSRPRTRSPPRSASPGDSPERIKAGLAYTLSEAADDGHCYLPAPNLIADAAKILDVPPELITPCLDELAAAEGVVREAVPGLRLRPHRRSPPSTCRPSIRPNGPWLTPCSACSLRGLTG